MLNIGPAIFQPSAVMYSIIWRHTYGQFWITSNTAMLFYGDNIGCLFVYVYINMATMCFIA